MTTVQTFRKKPVEVQAIQWTGDNTTEVIDWVLATGDRSARWHEATHGFGGTNKDLPPSPEFIAIDTLEGTMRAVVGDWIIRGVQGEHYPCKPDIFAATYERASR
ncbi:hypothetical protein ABGB07_02190 [Micromonosporaceae bacterium B7E4]